MATNTKIEWCDHTFNPWEGCTKVSPGCANCYAEARNKRWSAGANWGPGAPRRRTSEANWRQPLKWDRAAKLDQDLYKADGFTWHRPRVFCASLADWLDDEVPNEWLADLFDLIQRTPNLDWLLLTKRPENWAKRLAAAYFVPGFSEARENWILKWSLRREAPANVWIGTTVEDQQRAEERIPRLLEIPARVRFLSCEPLLGAVNIEKPVDDLGISDADWIGNNAPQIHPGINWVICGGESGPNARPMHPDWARSLRDQCQAAGVPFFFKQWGEWFPGYNEGGEGFYFDDSHGMPEGFPAKFARHEFPPEANGEYQEMARIGKKAAGRLLDGREHNEFPEVQS